MPTPLPPLRALALPLVFTLALAAFALLPAAAEPTLRLSFLGAAAVLLAWNAALALTATRAHRTFSLDFAARRQHWVQPIVQLSIYAYWGYYWRPVYQFAFLIASQIVFAYAIDMLIAWSRRDHYTLTFGPFPIIFSTNLFLWFKPEWFYLQYVMVGIGFAAKEMIRWQREGRMVHIFNPAAFTLALVSVVLLATGTTGNTYAPEIATTLNYAPHIYLWIFVVGLPGQLFFGVTTMTMSAVATVFVLGQLYFAVTGTFFFLDADVPIAVFLGMHLLFTDPSTSPRSELARILYGVLYGVLVMVAKALLFAGGGDTFYDKLLPLPLLNLSVRAIERFAAQPWARAIDPGRVLKRLVGRARYLVYMTAWAGLFTFLSLTNHLGDSHPGEQLPFWMRACAEDRPLGCTGLGTKLATDCRLDTPWACNELAILIANHKIRVEPTAQQIFARACELGSRAGCENAELLKGGGEVPALKRLAPSLDDYRKMLATKGMAPPKSVYDIYRVACDQGWTDGCVALGYEYLSGKLVARDKSRAAQLFDDGCTGGSAIACSNLALMYEKGDGLPPDRAKALTYLQKACDLGLTEACDWLKQPRLPTPQH